MAVHDWTRVLPGAFHDFHGRWITHLSESLNAGLLPADYYALSEQAELTATRQRTLVIRHASGDRIVALLEIGSPGNKDRRAADFHQVTFRCSSPERWQAAERRLAAATRLAISLAISSGERPSVSIS